MNCNISCRSKILSSWTFLAVKVNGSDVKTVHEDKIFERQDILQFLSQVSKYYKSVKSPTMI